MNAPAAIAGTFADFKLIKTRSACQLVIEVAIENADAALSALGGVPQPGQEKPVAVARLEPEAGEDAQEAMGATPVQSGSRSPGPAEPDVDTNGDRRPETGASEDAGRSRPSLGTARSQECGRFCNDAEFQAFLQDVHTEDIELALIGNAYGPVEAASVVRQILRIQSRRELDTDDGAWQRWCGLMSDYACWQDAQKRRGADG